MDEYNKLQFFHYTSLKLSTPHCHFELQQPFEIEKQHAVHKYNKKIYKWTQLRNSKHKKQKKLNIRVSGLCAQLTWLCCCSCRPWGALWHWRVEPVDVPVICGWVPWCIAAEGTGCWGKSPPLRRVSGQSHGWPTQTQVSHLLTCFFYNFCDNALLIINVLSVLFFFPYLLTSAFC